MSTFPAFTVPTKVLSGIGSLSQLPTELSKLGGTRIAVISDRGIHEVGLLAKILAGIDPNLLSLTYLVDPDPGVDAVELAVEQANASKCDLVLGIGGGSALGVAKALAIRLTNDQRIDAYEGAASVPRAPVPTIAIPTTAGSGSEVSKVLVLHEPGKDVELVLRAEGCEPRVAILDAAVLRTLPDSVMLYAGLDALSHCLESLWASRASFFSTGIAVFAAQAIIDSLPPALEGVGSGRNASKSNDDVLQRLLNASSAANMACGNSGLALVHALSSAPSVKIPHGLKNGTLLPYVAKFNDSISGPEAQKIVSQIEGLYERIDFVPRFKPGAVGSEGVTAMISASTGHPFRANNRRESTDADLRDILNDAGAYRESN